MLHGVYELFIVFFFFKCLKDIISIYTFKVIQGILQLFMYLKKRFKSVDLLPLIEIMLC